MNKVELLAPAGSREAFLGALSAGADAVYLAGRNFGARAYAANFDDDELIRTISDAHVFGVKIYLTVNVLTRQDELPELVKFVRRMYEHGLDGVIVQDLGVVRELRSTCPGLLLHASTQMSITGAPAVPFLKSLGISRVVPARELSLEEIQTIRREGIEVEAFIHGAMCYSYSGRCLLSGFLGGRSGNRGRCAGTCRLPWQVLGPDGEPAGPDAEKKPGTCYPLSMKDMCVLQILPELIDAGIDSFKIEGRMKKPEYVAGTTAIYRRYIDRFYGWDRMGRPGKWMIDRRDLSDLLSLYIRTDLSEGYYHTRNGRKLLTIQKPGYAGADDRLLRKIRDHYLQELPHRPVCGKAVILPGQPAQLTVTLLPGQQGTAMASDAADIQDQAVIASVMGEEVQTAAKRPVTEENIREKLTRTGETLFYFQKLDVITSGDVFISIKGLNELRRRALDQLSRILQEPMLPAEREKNLGQKGQNFTSGRKSGIKSCADPAAIAENTPGQVKAPGLSRDSTDLSQDSTAAARTARRNIPGGLWALVTSRDQLKAAVKSEVSVIILDGPCADSLIQGEYTLPACDAEYYLALPYVSRSDDFAFMESAVAAVRGIYHGQDCDRIKNIDGFFVRTLEELSYIHEKAPEFPVVTDACLYHWNRSAQAVLAKEADRLVMPLEVNGSYLLDTFRDSMDKEILTVYGYLPMMVSAGCIRKTENLCSGRGYGREEFFALRDRRGTVFPVRTVCGHCYNIIYNSLPLSLHRFATSQGPLRECCEHAGARLCIFTRETKEETGRILAGFSMLENGRAEEGCHYIESALLRVDESLPGTRDRRANMEDFGSSSAPEGEKERHDILYTTGHYRHSVL